MQYTPDTIHSGFTGVSGIVWSTINEMKNSKPIKLEDGKATTLEIALKTCEQYQKQTILEANNTRHPPVMYIYYRFRLYLHIYLHPFLWLIHPFQIQFSYLELVFHVLNYFISFFLQYFSVFVILKLIQILFHSDYYY